MNELVKSRIALKDLNHQEVCGPSYLNAMKALQDKVQQLEKDNQYLQGLTVSFCWYIGQEQQQTEFTTKE